MWKWETELTPKGAVVIVHDMMEHHEYYLKLISDLNKEGYHCLMGDLPGAGQTTRINKGHVKSFNQYTDRIKEWIDIVDAYEVPTFVIGQGLGALIVLELMRKETTNIDGAVLLNPLLVFKQSFMNRKNLLKSSIRMTSDESRFKLGFDEHSFTTDKNYLERYQSDDIVVREVSYSWYQSVLLEMKAMRENIDEVRDIPVLVMYSEENDIIDVRQSMKLVNQVKTSYFHSVKLSDVEHSIFQREDTETPLYYLMRFLDDQLFEIGFNIKR